MISNSRFVLTSNKAAAVRLGLCLALGLCWMALWRAVSYAQNVQHTKGVPDQGLRSDFKVDPSTLGMRVSIPLRVYAGRAGTSVPVTLYYSSKVWRIKYVGYSRGVERGTGEGLADYTNFTLTTPEYGEESAAGWTSSLSVPKIVRESTLAAREEYNRDGRPCGDDLSSTSYTATDPCHPNNRKTVYRLRVKLPDGSTHELRKNDAVHPASLNDGSDLGVYEAVDDSRLRYDNRTATLYLPDGSRYVLGEELGPGVPSSYVDRNGNKLTFDGVWRDTLGRSISPPPLVSDNETRTPGDVTYSLPGVGGNLNYVLRWSYLVDVRTDGDQTLYKTGNRMCAGSYQEELAPALFATTGDDLVCGATFNPVVLSEIILPDNTSYRFTYNRYGEIDKVYYPTGGYELYQYGPIPSISAYNLPYAQATRGVLHRWVSTTSDGPAQEPHWRYTSDGGKVTETSPDGTVTERLLHVGKPAPDVLFGYDDVRAGMPYDERVYASTGQLLRRKLIKWEVVESFATSLPGGAVVNAQRFPRVAREVEILLDTGALEPLSKTTAYQYGQTGQPLNVTAATEYAYQEVARSTAEAASTKAEDVPTGTALRSTETKYKDDPAYTARNLVTLLVRTTVRAGEVGVGPVVARTENFYDEMSYFGTDTSLLPCGATEGRDAATPAERGNVTTVSRWLNTLGAIGNASSYLDTHVRYDQCGNVRMAWGAAARGSVSPRVSEVEFSAEYQYAYPTHTLTPIPDATGQKGASVPLRTTTAYDFDTGLVLSVIDVNNQTTTAYSYADPDTGLIDPLNRLRLMSPPGGGWTRYDYGNAPGNFFIRTRAALEAGRHTDAYQFFDGLARPARAYAFDGTAADRTWVATKITYDAMGRVSKTSNPLFRTDHNDFEPPASALSTNTYEALGRVASVTTPDGAVVKTSYSGREVTTTDQAGKARRSLSDALGRLKKVIEAPGVSGFGYETAYD